VDDGELECGVKVKMMGVHKRAAEVEPSLSIRYGGKIDVRCVYEGTVLLVPVDCLFAGLRYQTDGAGVKKSRR
jgi:hypothetical protein